MEKALNKLNERQLVKMATEKAWKNYQDKVESKTRLKEILKKVLKKEKIGFIYTWRINDVRDYGTMYGDNYKVYESVLRNLNYIENYSHWDSKFTKEVDSVFVWDKDYYRNKENFKIITDFGDKEGYSVSELYNLDSKTPETFFKETKEKGFEQHEINIDNVLENAKKYFEIDNELDNSKVIEIK